MIKEVSDTKEEIEKYQLVKKIGNGSFGKVYLAVDERLHKRWAIKCIPRSVPNAELEGFLLNKLKHPGIPAIWDVFSGEKNWYLVMEYVEGQTLGEFLLERGRVRTGQVLAWGIELCDILIYLHERNPAVIHGDLKPENIIKNKDGKLVLIDFGAARELLPQNPENWMGTKEYQPPECQKGEFSEKTDIYMLGCVMRELWDGRHGWRLSRIIRRCMHANPGKRYANAKMLQKELAEEWKRQKEERRILPEALIGMGILILAAGTSLTEVPVGHPQRVTVIQESPQEKFAEVLKFYAAELYEEGILKEDAGLLRAGIRLFKQEQELNGREDYGQKLRIALGYRILGEEGKAAGWYEGAIALCPRRPEAYAAYGWQLVMAGDAKKALELLKRGEASGMQQDDNVEKLVAELKRRGFE